MGLFGSKGRNHLNGYKELSKHSEIITLEANEGTKVYFPTMAPNKTAITYDVKEGDKVLAGQKIGTRTDFYVPIYSSVSGTVSANEKVFSTQLGMPIPHVVIVSDGKNELAEPLKTVTLDSSVDEIFDAIKESGICGMGGAGFPTYVKYSGKNNGKIHTLLINGVECEPYLTTDFVKSIEDADKVVAGAELLMKVCGAEKCLICLKVHKEEARDALKAACEGHANITVREVPDQYPMGWEKTLIQEVMKKTYERLPSEVGVIVNNLQTVLSMGDVLLTGRPVTDRLVTVSGDAIANPTNVRIKLGMTADLLINACGGYSAEEVSLIPGGPMCSKSVSTDKFPMLLPMGSLTILKFKKMVADQCLRCGACSLNCPAQLQPVELKRAFECKDVDRMIALDAMSCVECGTCSYVCPSHIEVTDYVKKCKGLVRLRKK